MRDKISFVFHGAMVTHWQYCEDGYGNNDDGTKKE